MTTKISRNAPCPCGSGKKYKRCCWPSKSATAADVKAIDDTNIASPWVIWDGDDLDEVSNSVIDLLADGKIDEAESAAKDVLKRYPEVVDGLERMGMVEEARGNAALAADYYRKAAQFTRTRPGYDPETTKYYTKKATELEKENLTQQNPD